MYTGNPLDRAGTRREDEAWLAAARAHPETLFVPIWRSRSLLRGVADGHPEAVFLSGEAAASLQPADLDRFDPSSQPDLPDQPGPSDLPAPSHQPWAFLGLQGPLAVFALDLSAAEDPLPLLPSGLGSFVDLRTAAGALPGHDAAILAYARGLMHWRSRHGFCGICGSPCLARSGGHVMRCTGCETSHFPRTDPAVIMLVHDGDRALLGHSVRFPAATMYSTLAGFVEPGESLEEAVAREVFEESGVRVGRVSYHSSQPWPFPASIMLGFTAEALSQEITIDHDELQDVRWFTRAELRDPAGHGFQLPRADSIARRLIEDWMASA
jgi:NAD+ diphosphatase